MSNTSSRIRRNVISNVRAYIRLQEDKYELLTSSFFFLIIIPFIKDGNKKQNKKKKRKEGRKEGEIGEEGKTISYEENLYTFNHPCSLK